MASVYDDEQKKREAQQYQQTVQSAQNLSYQPSQAAANARQYLDTLTQNKPGGYMSRYGGQMESLLAQIQGRQPFRYDARTDPLYQVYRDMYINDGRRAMQDTMGQAAALTGGYGNSYAQSVGQQQYNQYMERLHGMLPQFQQQAYQQYQGEGDALAQNYALLAQADQADYGRFRDAVKDMMAAGVGGSGGGGGGGSQAQTKTGTPGTPRTGTLNLIDPVYSQLKPIYQNATGNVRLPIAAENIQGQINQGPLADYTPAMPAEQANALLDEMHRLYQQDPAVRSQATPSMNIQRGQKTAGAQRKETQEEDALAAWLNMKKK